MNEIASDARRRRSFAVPEEWKQEFASDRDPGEREHYRQFRNLKATLRDHFGVRPETIFPTHNQRGVVKLNLRELFWLMFEDEDQPNLVADGAEVTAEAEEGRFGDPMSVQHRGEVELARSALAKQQIYPSSMAPTQDYLGRVTLTFDQLEKLLVGDR